MSTSAYSPTSAGRSRPEGAAVKYPDVRNYISGRFVAGGDRFQDINDPSDGSVIARVPMGGAAEVDAAVAAARAALPGWASTPIKERVQVFFRYKALLERHLAELSALISEEHGKVKSEADAEILKAIELTEFACSMPQLVAGETMEVSRGVECRVERYPVGIVASIVPFNFPSMVPHWTIPNAIALGNCFILKPSERVPLSAERIATLLTEAGLPRRRLQHGERWPRGGRSHLRSLRNRGGHLRRFHRGRP